MRSLERNCSSGRSFHLRIRASVLPRLAMDTFGRMLYHLRIVIKNLAPGSWVCTQLATQRKSDRAKWNGRGLMVGERGFEPPTSRSRIMSAAKNQVFAFSKVAATKDLERFTFVPILYHWLSVECLGATLQREPYHRDYFERFTRMPCEISLCNQILAVRQSRSTVGVETPSTFAVSSIVSPPKYLSSTSWAFRGSIIESV